MLFFKKKKPEPPKTAAPAAAVPKSDPMEYDLDIMDKAAGFEQSFGEVTIKTVRVSGKGCCLEARYRDFAIIMDVVNTESNPVPDGTNAYMFGNKLIVVTRWGGLSDGEKEKLSRGELVLAVHPYEFMQFSLQIGGGWEDVFFTLPHCMSVLNDEEKPVDELIYIGCDSNDASFINCRTVKLPPFIQKLLMKGNIACHKALSLDDDDDILALRELMENERALYEESGLKYAASDAANGEWLVCDHLYDKCFKATRDIADRARAVDPANIKGGIYLLIGSDDTVKDMKQR